MTSPRVRRLTNNPYDINAAGFSQYLETMPEPREERVVDRHGESELME